MKTSKSKTALRALVVSLVLLGAAFQTNVAEAGCTVTGNGVTVSCSGEEGICHVNGVAQYPVSCTGNEVAVKATELQKEPSN